MIEVKDYPEEFYTIGNRKYTARAMTADEVRLWNQDFQRLISGMRDDPMSEHVKDILVRNEVSVFIMTRCSMAKAKLPYEGRATNGNGMAIDWVSALDVLGSETWDVTYTSTGDQPFWDSTTSAGTPMTLNDKTGVIILGMASKSVEPKVSKIKWKKDGSELGAHELAWDFIDSMVVEEPFPIIVLPESTILGTVHVAATGTDYLRPIAIKATTGDRLRNLGAGDLE